MTMAERYLEALKQAYIRNGREEKWNRLEAVAWGINDRDEAELRELYPLVPQTLVDILRRIDGTYYRPYEDVEICEYFFGSDVDGGRYPYYLFSWLQITDNVIEPPYFADMFNAFYGPPELNYGVFIDERISPRLHTNSWLCFSECMNNGGTSSLFIDFTPSEKGKAGQIIRFLHDPDRLDVIADSFDELLAMLMEGGMKFIPKNR